MLFFTNNLFAKVLCKTPVFYTWEKIKIENKKQNNPQKKEKNTAKETKEKLVDYWGVISANGETKEEAEKKLEIVLLEKRGMILNKCKEEHEGSSHCLAGKYSRLKEVLDSSNFDVRKEIEESIKKDCSDKLGMCLDIEKKEASCEIIQNVIKNESEKGKKKKK